ncbi:MULTISPECIES: hypothetical protein [unclassified Frondihabitans]|uniref:hypothetical protein n=1 Tax=unclassified Frondihabitans TaxID=2626248 RepID=UPI000F4D78B8|nr:MULTISPECIES: hypothetical protein [unclassified Frondihabitans]
MHANDDEYAYLAAMMEKERAKLFKVNGRRIMSEARKQLASLTEALDLLVVQPGGKADALDRHFANTVTFLPSTLIKTQLRLGVQYAEAADVRPWPTLASFVVLRTSIECTATAHWLMSVESQREGIARVLQRMWWDTMNAVDMAVESESDPDLSGVDDLRRRITAIAGPIKRLDADSIMESQRVSLSGIVRGASLSLHPDSPGALYAAWMTCAGISHGNVPISAGAGMSPESIQVPSKHPIDESTFGFLFAVAVADLAATVGLFRRWAAEQHSNLRPPQP